MAQKKDNNSKVGKTLKAPIDLPDICKGLPKFQYGEDSTEIIYFEKVDLNTNVLPLLEGVKIPELGSDVQILFKQIRKDRLRFFYWYLPTFGIDLDANIELSAEGQSLFIKVYKTKVFYEESKKYIPMGTLRAMLYSPNMTRTPFYCEKLIIYDQKIKEVIANLKQQVLDQNTKASN